MKKEDHNKQDACFQEEKYWEQRQFMNILIIHNANYN